jgi:diguanylate cyclase (GGDEF)-like protein
MALPAEVHDLCFGVRWGATKFDMKLDFTTLYVLILLNSVGFAVTWAMISYSYRTVVSARFWFAALLMTCLSGPLLVLGEGSRLLTYVGILLTVASFAMIWQGVRVFSDRPPQWGRVAALLLASGISMMMFGSSREADNIIFAVSQLVPIVSTIAALLMFDRRSVGVWVAAVAGSVLVAGQSAEAVTNLLHTAGVMTTDDYYSVAAWFLVCAIVGASILNLGLLLIVTDRLRAELYSLATRDDLTGLPNRRALRERMALVEKSAKRKNQSAVVMMIDLDHFKAINDQYGHDAGDAALVHIASVLNSFLREFDFLARVGGDEFCMLLPNTKSELATAIALRLNEAIARRRMHWRGDRIAVPASIGFAEWQPGSEVSLSESLSLADEKMFGTKRRGRSVQDATTRKAA